MTVQDDIAAAVEAIDAAVTVLKELAQNASIPVQETTDTSSLNTAVTELNAAVEAAKPPSFSPAPAVVTTTTQTAPNTGAPA